MEKLAHGHTKQINSQNLNPDLTVNLSHGIIGLQNYVHAISAVSDLGQVTEIPISVHYFSLK